MLIQSSLNAGILNAESVSALKARSGETGLRGDAGTGAGEGAGTGVGSSMRADDTRPEIPCDQPRQYGTTMGRITRLRAPLASVALALVAAFAIAACGGSDETTATPPELPDTARVYLLFDQPTGGPYLLPAARPGVPREPEAVLQALLDGATESERGGYPVITTGVPEGVTLTSVQVVDGVATATFAGDFAMEGGIGGVEGRLAQVVYTLTALPGIASVMVEAPGLGTASPLARGDFDGVLPPIFVEDPAFEGEGGAPLIAHGSVASDIDEVTLLLAGREGRVLAEETFRVNGTREASGRRGFVFEIEWDGRSSQPGLLMVWSGDDQVGLRQQRILLEP